MIVVLEKELPQLFETAVLPDFPGCNVALSAYGNDISILVNVPGGHKAELTVERPKDGLVALLDSLESLEAQLNAFLDARGLLLELPENLDLN